MLLYWLLFAVFATGAILSTGGDPFHTKKPSGPILLAGLFIVALVGLRFRVGADWESYDFMFSYAGYADWGRVLTLGDPGYQTLNGLVQHAGMDIWMVNLVCAAIFTWGLGVPLPLLGPWLDIVRPK